MILLRMMGDDFVYDVWAKDIVGSGLGQYGLVSYQRPRYVDGVYCGSWWDIASKQECYPFAYGKTPQAALSAAREFISCIEARGENFGAFIKKAASAHLDRLQKKSPNGVPCEAWVIDRAPIERRRVEIWERDGGACVYCAIPLPLDGDWHIDHVVPKSRGGTNDKANLALSCPKCNMSKAAKSAEEFMAKIRGMRDAEAA